MNARELGPVIEAMWREGMRYHEIAVVFDISNGSVHRLIRARVPAPERAAQTAARREDGRSSDERRLAAVRKAASVLAEAPAIDAGECGEARAAIDRWLSERGEPIRPAAGRYAPERLSPAELRGELDRFEAGLHAGGLRASTIQAYLLGSSLFVRWLAGDYVPGPRRTRPPSAPAALRGRYERRERGARGPAGG